MFQFIFLQSDTLSKAASSEVAIKGIESSNEISVLTFILKGGFF